MIHGLHLYIQKRKMKPLTIPLTGTEGKCGESSGDDLTNVQCKPIQNCHNESPCTTNIS
jgi:hypothetical protein